MSASASISDLESAIRKTLSDLDDYEELLDVLKKMGVTKPEDLKYVEAKSLTPLLTIVQAKKLLEAFSDDRKKDGRSLFRMGNMSKDEYQESRREVYERAKKLIEQPESVETQSQPPQQERTAVDGKVLSHESSENWFGFTLDQVQEKFSSTLQICVEHKKLIGTSAAAGVATGGLMLVTAMGNAAVAVGAAATAVGVGAYGLCKAATSGEEVDDMRNEDVVGKEV